jgi:putative toxin-antitoxin system antitoxin component (TIGR02293 family)
MAHTTKIIGTGRPAGRPTGKFGQPAKSKKLAPTTKKAVRKGLASATEKTIKGVAINTEGSRIFTKRFSATQTFALIGPATSTGADLVYAIRRGLSVEAVDEIVQSGSISNAEINDLVLPRRTLANRRAVGTLTADQSDKLMRVVRVISKAESTFGNPEKAHRWLRRPTAPLNGHAPLQLLDTEAGARLVEDLLIRIDHGIAA